MDLTTNNLTANQSTSTSGLPVTDPLAVQPVAQKTNLPQIQSNLPQQNANTQGAGNLDINSIISEINNDLKKEPQAVTQDVSQRTNIDLPATSALASDANVVTYNLNAEDTFQENYKNQIEISNPVKIDSTPEGLKEIRPIEDYIPSQMIDQAISTQTLQYKNYSLKEILLEAMSRKASDIHLTPGYRATFRIDGSLKTFNSPILTEQNVKEYAKELAKARKELDIENIKEADLTYSIGSKRFRVNIFKQMGNYSVVCRVINENILPLDALGLPPILSSLTKFANGLVLLTGPTGSGKSTTLASILNTINLTDSKHIITLEDPIEYVLPKGLSLIDQREFGIDFTSWPTALRSVLRQDPDIVLIGEMRDLESIEAALQVAETGHLVFATLHTNSAAQSIERIIDVFPSTKQDQIRIQLASVIRGVISQRLIPLSQGGRQPVVEVVFSNVAVQNAIRESKVYLIDNVIQTSSEEGMISLEKSLVQLIKEGKISSQVAKNYSIKPNEIDLLLTK